MNYRTAWLIVAIGLILTGTGVAAPPVEILSQAGPHGTAPQQWLQRLADAGAGSTRLVSRGQAKPRLDELGTVRGKQLVKVYAVLTRSNELLLPAAGGFEKYRLSDREKLAEFFQRLEAGGVEAITTPRDAQGLTEAQLTDRFVRLQTPMPPIEPGATLQRAIEQAARTARVTIEIDPSVRDVVAKPAEGATAVERLTTGTALAALLKDEGLALVSEPATSVVGVNQKAATTGVGGPPLRVIALKDATKPWPVGYEPQGSISQTAPVLMDFLTIEIEGYTFKEALDALQPRLLWKKEPMPIVWDRYTMRANAIDPTTTQVKFPRKRTFYKKVLDRMAFQTRLKLELRVDEAGTPFLWLTR